MGGVYWWHQRVPPIDAVVVDPLTASGGPPWLAGAITEEIVDALRPAAKPEAGRELTAKLNAQVSMAGDRAKVVATLSSLDGHRYWTKTFERPLPEVGRDVAAAILPGVRHKASKHKFPAGAYESYLQGRERVASKDFMQAMSNFEAATDKDGGFAAAWAWLSIAREYLAETGSARPNELLPGARDAAERAVTLDPESADTHLALGIVKLQYDWDWETAGRELERALELRPGDPRAAQWHERWLEAMNKAPAAPVPLANLPHDPDEARRLLAEADDLRARSYVSPLEFALAANLAHDSESLFHWLDVAYEERSVQLPYLLRSPALPQSDPRLLDLIHRLKLPANP